MTETPLTKDVRITVTLTCRADVPVRVVEWIRTLAEHCDREFGEEDYRPEWNDGYEGPRSSTPSTTPCTRRPCPSSTPTWRIRRRAAWPGRFRCSTDASGDAAPNGCISCVRRVRCRPRPPAPRRRSLLSQAVGPVAAPWRGRRVAPTPLPLPPG